MMSSVVRRPFIAPVRQSRQHNNCDCLKLVFGYNADMETRSKPPPKSMAQRRKEADQRLTERGLRRVVVWVPDTPKDIQDIRDAATAKRERHVWADPGYRGRSMTGPISITLTPAEIKDLGRALRQHLAKRGLDVSTMSARPAGGGSVEYFWVSNRTGKNHEKAD